MCIRDRPQGAQEVEEEEKTQSSVSKFLWTVPAGLVGYAVTRYGLHENVKAVRGQIIGGAITLGFYSLFAVKNYLWKSVLGLSGVLFGVVYSKFVNNPKALTNGKF
eukprot:TRINITY_DN3095_c0_g1_i1.p2 TRINITY_DN3095_c0_g1~~TRINITY_DN3095_c0_g1_i1.p2  ORF type:complete len:106 (+),score=20.10 TRINITY_DN3095_c0_g1_i1:67-384(+)